MSAFLPLLIIGLGIVVLTLLLVILIPALRRSRQKQGGGKTKKNKNRDQLLKEANKRLSQNPKDSQALAILAEIYFNDANWEMAITTYAALLESAGTNAELNEFEITMRHGIAAMNLKRFEEAYHSLSVARAINPEVYEINFNLGVLEYNRKNYERAVTLLNIARAGRPEDLETRKFLGMSMFRIKKYKEAIDVLKSVIDEQMDDKEAIYYLAYCYFENGQLEMSVQLFSHLRPDPNFGPQASLMAGSIHLKQKAYNEAEQDFEIGLRHKTMKKDVLLELRYRLATTLMRNQDISNAVTHLKAIYEMEPGYKDVASLIKSNAEVSQNQFLHTYLLGAPSDFVSLCRKLSGTFFAKAHTKVIDIFVEKGDYADVLAEVETPAWEDLILYRFVRSTGQVGEFVLRDLYMKIKDLKAGRGFCVSAGTYSESAVKFVEARSIDLVDKEGLMTSLNKVQKMLD